jgi:hypothetical protein
MRTLPHLQIILIWELGLQILNVRVTVQSVIASPLLCVPLQSLPKILPSSQVPVAHAYDPRYSEGRDQENCSLKPAQANSS